MRRHIHPEIPSGNPVVEGSWWISCSGLGEDPIQQLTVGFQADHHEMVHVRDILFYSTCEHHLLPMIGKAHVGYIPDGKVVGLSKLARVVEGHSRRPQLQERLTARVADALHGSLGAQGPSSWWRRITSA